MTATANGALVPFTVHVEDDDLHDLRARLTRTRLPEPATVDGWAQGVPLDWLRELLADWERHDWRATERRLNALPHFRTEIDGLGLHVVHARSPHPDATPLLLTHGWPGSFMEFEKVIGPLTDPTAYGGRARDAFHVVVPSLPGYGFSDRPTEAGWDVERIARAWRTLMARLGYPRYGAQGGDWGLLVTTAMAEQRDDPQAPGPVAVHLSPPPAGPDPANLHDLTDAEQASMEAMAHYGEDGLGYATLMRTRPQTIGYALTDSPAALAAFVGEKLQAWSDADNPAPGFGRREALDLLSLYWFTATGASAARLYWESFPTPRQMSGTDEPHPVDLPVAGMIMPADHGRPSRRWAQRRFPDIRRWTELPRGGHFPALEVSALYVEEMRAFFGTVM